jgi:hypothetical protein
MIAEVATIFEAVSFVTSAAEFLGLLEDRLQAKLDQLAGSELEAGTRALRQAADSQTEQQWLLREARGRFNKAVSLETGLRQALAHLGLALCHWQLGDRTNAAASLRELSAVEPPAAPLVAAAAEKVANAPWWVRRLVPFASLSGRAAGVVADSLKRGVVQEQEALAELKQSAEAFLRRLSV